MMAGCDLRWVHGAITEVAFGRWRALFEVPFGRSPGRNKLRSQAVIVTWGLPTAGAGVIIHLSLAGSLGYPLNTFFTRVFTSGPPLRNGAQKRLRNPQITPFT